MMASTHLPPLNFGDGLRISLFPTELDIPQASKLPDVSELVFAELDGRDLETSKPKPVVAETLPGSSYEPPTPRPLVVEAPSQPSHPPPDPRPVKVAEAPSKTSQPSPPPTPAPPPPPPLATIPVHPIPSLQDAFTESLEEVTNGTGADKPKLRQHDARARRELLLAQDKDAEPFDAAWRYRKGQKQHELFKLISQISFGVYLLLNSMANSNAQVISILQGHIDEVDEFLEVTLEDLKQAMEDLNGRMDHLKLPLSNIQMFEELLEDRNFRMEILAGNEKIDHVLSRTNTAMRQWDDDIDAGLQCTAAFTSWLNDERDEVWRAQRPDVVDVFDAMKGNAEGWLSAFDEINDRTQDVNNLIIRLTTVIAEMEKKAGEVSRRTWEAIPPFSAPSHASRSPVSGSKPMSLASGASSRGSQAGQPHARPPLQHRPSSRTVHRPQTADTSDFDTETIEFPLPGCLPLLPPRSTVHHAAKDSVDSRASNAQESLRSVSSPESNKENRRHSPSSDEQLYVLQPRTYTPQPSSPMSSVMLKEAADIAPKTDAKAQPQSSQMKRDADNKMLKKKGSIRHRVSLKKNPPDAILIPPRSIADMPVRGPTPNLATPRTVTSQPFDSGYGPGVEARSRRQGSNVGSDYSMSPPTRPQVNHSPRSDHQQYYRPVRASPHSPLQQRPHTAAGARASHFQPQHLRNQPSQLGGMSTLSNVTMATYDDRSTAPSTRTRRTARTAQESDRTLKKKKSAFGWFKKAFTLDEEEKAAFEARRAMAQNDQYYNPNSPKFLDGRRIR